ncbi:MAG: TspO/MBR family protein [Candidatus Nanopelagicus sp.]
MKTNFQSIAGIFGIALVFIYAIGASRWTTTGSSWYRSLNAPSWQPPDFIFGIIWPYNFVILGVAAVSVANQLSTTKTIAYLSIFALSIFCALTWSYQFYGPHNLSLASAALVATAVLTIPMLFFIYQASVAVFIATLPYQIWVIIASYLSASYAKLN